MSHSSESRRWSLEHAVASMVSTCRFGHAEYSQYLPDIMKMHFVIIFGIFAKQSVHGRHFWLHFLLHFITNFLLNNENDPKMNLKMS